jgi:phytoene dehydrogenase-like protein
VALLDAVVVGSGPNGLSAAVELARSGASVTVLEEAPTIGGGTRTAELTLPGFRHDVCSAAHPLGILSPYLSTLPLAEHGLTWIQGAASVAHPLEGEPAVILGPSLETTATGLGRDATAYRRLIGPLLLRPRELLAEILGPAHLPAHPIALSRFGIPALLPATVLGRTLFREQRARALLAGCAAHSILPLTRPVSAAVGMVFFMSAHLETWPVAAGGSSAITSALAGYLESLGGSIETGRTVRSLADLPPTRVTLFDTSPKQVAGIVRRTFIQLIQDELGMEVQERSIDRTELFLADELFFGGTGVQLVSITKIDHHLIADGKMGPFTLKLRDLFFDVVFGRMAKYRNWCMPIYKK